VRGLLAGFGVAIPLGPITLLIVELGIRHGFPSAFSGALGAATADLAYAAVAVSAGIFIAGFLAPVAKPLHYVSGVVLLFIGLWLLNVQRHKLTPDSKEQGLNRHTYLQNYTMILSLTLLNPLTITYFTALILSLQTSAGYTLADTAFFVAGIFTASLSWQTIIAGMGTLVGKRVSPRVNTLTQIMGSSLVIGLGIAILLGFY
jgi:threonine/homoserine/homoserine lactone efflux protein